MIFYDTILIYINEDGPVKFQVINFKCTEEFVPYWGASGEEGREISTYCGGYNNFINKIGAYACTTLLKLCTNQSSL